MKRILHNVITVWLAIVLFFGSTPKEFIHLFANHTDTVHSVHEKDGAVIESLHHHCTFLSYALPLFLNNSLQVSYTYHTPAIYPAYRSVFVVHFAAAKPSIAFLRGPPVA